MTSNDTTVTYSVCCEIDSSFLVAFKMWQTSRHVKRHLNSIIVDQNPAQENGQHAQVAVYSTVIQSSHTWASKDCCEANATAKLG